MTRALKPVVQIDELIAIKRFLQWRIPIQPQWGQCHNIIFHNEIIVILRRHEQVTVKQIR